MEVKQTTREITDYHFRLDGDEMAAMLADPIAWAAELRARLNYQTPLAPTPPAANGKRHSKGAARKTGPKGAARKVPAGDPPTCFKCGKVFKTQGWLNKHLAKPHPSQTESATDSPD